MKKRVSHLLVKSFSLNLKSLGLFRILLGLTLVADIVDRWPSAVAHYTDHGVLNSTLVLQQNEWWKVLSPYFWISDAAGVYFVFSAHVFFAVFFAIGYKTRISNAFLLILTVFLNARNPNLEHGIDLIAKSFLFIGLFLPLEEYFSVDSKGKEKRAEMLFSPGTIAFLLQVLCIYLTAAIAKSFGQNWGNGEAVYYVMKQQSNIFSFWIDDFKSLIPLFTYGTIFTQFFSLTIIFPVKTKWFRLTAWLFLTGLHVGIFATMNLRAFAFAPLAFLIAIFPFEVFSTSINCPQKILKKKNQWVIIVFTILIVLNSITQWICLSRGSLSNNWISKTLKIIQLRQEWILFAGVENKITWFLIKVKGEKGKTYDFLRESEYVDDSRYIDYSKWSHVRWRAIFLNLQGNKSLQKSFSNYLCHKYNNLNPVKIEVDQVQKELSLKEDGLNKVKKEKLFSYSCNKLRSEL